MTKKREADPTIEATGQGRRFIAAARELGCDQSEEVFADRLRIIGKQRTKEEAAKNPKEKKTPPT